MMRYFNTEGLCDPDFHYMVKLDDRLSSSCFENERPEAGIQALKELAEPGRDRQYDMGEMFARISSFCGMVSKPVVMMIDEVDSASNNQVFLDFLAMLGGYYLERKSRPAFHTVILAGVYDVKNLKLKIRPEAEHKYNSPWYSGQISIRIRHLVRRRSKWVEKPSWRRLFKI